MDATHRTTRLVTAGDVLAFQAMAGMYKTGMLLTEGGGPVQNSVSFSHGWCHQLPREQIIRTIHHEGTKTKRIVSVIQKLLREADYRDTNDDIQAAPLIDIWTGIINERLLQVIS